MENLKSFLKKIEDYNVVYWILVVTFIVLIFSLIIIYSKGYIAKYHLASSLPLAVLAGSIAIAISPNRNK